MREVKIGQKYRHFKGHIVEVTGIAIHTETMEDMVVYRYNGKLWTRPKEMFLSEVDHEKYPGVTQRYRFEELNIYEYERAKTPSRTC